MKRIILLLPLLIFGFTAFPQAGRKILGVTAAPQISTDGRFALKNVGKQDYGLNTGIFYNWDVNGNFGFTANVELRFENKVSDCYNCPNQPRRYQNNALSNYYYLDVPVNLAYNLDRKENSQFRSYVLFGYTYSRLLYFYQTATDQGQAILIKQEEVPEGILVPRHHTINLGLDLRYQFFQNFIIGFSPVARLPVFYINEPIYVALNLKLGRIL